MPLLLFLLIAVSALAQPANELRVKKYGPNAGSGGWVPFTFGRAFPENGPDSIQGFPQPLVNGAAPPAWQADIRQRYAGCNKVRFAVISLPLTSVTATLAGTKITFTNSADPCSSPCSPVTRSDILALNWGAFVRAQPFPSSGATALTIDARNEIVNNRFETSISGPFHTRIKVHRDDEAGTGDFGWKRRGVVRFTQLMFAGDATIPVEETADIAAALQTVDFIDGRLYGDGIPDKIRVCGTGVNASGQQVVRLGASKANCNGGGADFVPSSNYSAATDGSFLYLQAPGEEYLELQQPLARTDLQMKLTGGADIIDSVAGRAVNTFQIEGMFIRTCGSERTGPNSVRVTIGFMTDTGCSASTAGRGWYGTPNLGVGHQPGTMVLLPLQGSPWIAAPSRPYKSLHPVFVMDFFRFDNTTFIKVEYRIENERVRQDQIYSLDFRTGQNADGILYSNEAVKQPSNSRFRKVFWIAGSPPDLRVDHGAAYLSELGVNPLDPGITATAAAIENEFTKIDAHAGGWWLGHDLRRSEDIAASTWVNGGAQPVLKQGALNNRCDVPSFSEWDNAAIFAGGQNLARDNAGPFLKRLGSGGGRPEIALIPRLHAIWMAAQGVESAFADRLPEAVYSIASCAGLIPLHYREPLPRGMGVGLPVSLDGRPSFNGTAPASDGDAADRMAPSGPFSSNGWTINSGTLSHIPQLAFLPYVTTGEEFWLDLLQTSASFAVTSSGNVFPVSSSSLDLNLRRRSRGKRLGLLTLTDGTRAFAWGFRDLALAAWASEDFTPQRTYYDSRLLNNAAAVAGMMGSTNCAAPNESPSYDPVTVAEAECYGRWHRGFAAANPLRTFWVGSANLIDAEVRVVFNQSRVFSLESPWMLSYLHGAFGWASRLGYTQIDFGRRELGRYLVTMAADDQTVHSLGGYRLPAEPCSTYDGGVGGLCFSSGGSTHVLTVGGARRVGFSNWLKYKNAFNYLPDSFAPGNFETGDAYAIMMLGALAGLPANTGCVDGVALPACTRDAAYTNFRERVESALGGDSGIIGTSIHSKDPRWAIPRR